MTKILKHNKKSKNPPFLSHDFIIQNHADIVSCVAMVFVVGLMIQSTFPISSVFVTLSHNATSFEELRSQRIPQMLYTNGFADITAVFFYSLICVVIHAVIQEYVIDKLIKKLQLSKTITQKFSQSGQLVAFMAISVLWGVFIIFRDGLLTGISALWLGYPLEHTRMTFSLKLYFIIQLAYWAHSFPELYFQKMKGETARNVIQTASIYLGAIGFGYLCNFNRITLVLLVLKYTEHCLRLVCDLLKLTNRTKAAQNGTAVWNILFVGCRLLSFILSILTFYYGLATLENQEFNIVTGNYNLTSIRLSALLGICLLQGYMMWTFINNHLQSIRKKEGTKTEEQTEVKKKKAKKSSSARKLEKKEKEIGDLPEADQSIRRRKQ